MSRSLLLLAVLAAPASADELDAARRDALARYGAGLLKARNDLPVQAVKQFEAAAKADPTSPAPHRELVKLYADLGRDPAAIRAARKALELDPADADTAHALGKLLYDGKKFADAAAALKQAAESPRAAPVKRFGVLRDLARAREAAGDWAGAEEALRSALAVAADHRAALLKAAAYPSPADLDQAAAAVRERLGQSLVEQRKFSEASAAFREAAKQFTAAGAPKAAARLGWNLSGALAAEGKVDDALEHLDTFLKLKPAGAAPYERYASLLRRLNRGRDVPGVLARMVDANPTNDAVRWVLASELARDDPAASDRLFRETADRTTALDHYRAWVRALTAANRPDQILREMDRLCQDAQPAEGRRTPDGAGADADPKRVERARAFAAAVKAEPGAAAAVVRRATADLGRGYRHPATWTLVVGLAEREGRADVVEIAVRRAAEAGGADATLRFLNVLAKLRKWDEVKAVAKKAIQSSLGNRPVAYDVYLATAHAELGEAPAALAILKDLPNDVRGEGYLWARLQKARVLNVLDQHAEAAAECQRLLGQFAGRGDVHDIRIELSNSYLGLARHAEAEAELRAVLEDDPDDALALNNLGYNLADQGRDLAEAEDMIRRAVALDRDELLKAGSPEVEKGTYLDSLGWVLFRRGKLAEARDLLEKAAAAPDAAADPIVWDHFGDACFRLGDKVKAREAWGRAAELYVGSHQGRQHGRLEEARRKLKQTE